MAHWVFGSSGVVIVFSALVLVALASAAPMDGEEEAGGSEFVSGVEVVEASPWDNLDADTLRKILVQLGDDERSAYMPRVTRSWSPLQRAWGASPRSLDNRAARQWRTDKRQVRFRQCYFNPISCFRK